MVNIIMSGRFWCIVQLKSKVTGTAIDKYSTKGCSDEFRSLFIRNCQSVRIWKCLLLFDNKSLLILLGCVHVFVFLSTRKPWLHGEPWPMATYELAKHTYLWTVLWWWGPHFRAIISTHTDWWIVHILLWEHSTIIFKRLIVFFPILSISMFKKGPVTNNSRMVRIVYLALLL